MAQFIPSILNILQFCWKCLSFLSHGYLLQIIENKFSQQEPCNKGDVIILADVSGFTAFLVSCSFAGSAYPSYHMDTSCKELKTNFLNRNHATRGMSFSLQMFLVLLHSLCLAVLLEVTILPITWIPLENILKQIFSTGTMQQGGCHYPCRVLKAFLASGRMVGSYYPSYYMDTGCEHYISSQQESMQQGGQQFSFNLIILAGLLGVPTPHIT